MLKMMSRRRRRKEDNTTCSWWLFLFTIVNIFQNYSVLASYTPQDICHGILQSYSSSAVEMTIDTAVSASSMCTTLQPQYNALFTLYTNTAGFQWRWKNSGGLPWCFTNTQCADYLSKQEYANPLISSVPNPCRQQWQGITCDSKNCTIVSIALRANQLVGTLPNIWQIFTNLTSLEITDNPCILRGKIPDSIYLLHSLQTLTLRDNLLSGTISSQVTKLYNLEKLDLRRNILKGSIPSNIGSLIRLTNLVLMGNDLTYSIPTSIVKLNKLVEIDVSFNFLSGSLPNIFNNITYLRSLFLNNNSFTGSIPQYTLQHLETLQLYSNYLSHDIPKSLYALPRLKLVDFRNNMLTGTLSESIANMFELDNFNVHSNQLDGSLPVGIWNVSTLRVLNVGDNFLYGSIPDITGNKSYFMYDLRLQQNLFSSTLPKHFGNLHNLSRLDISTNLLESPLPLSFANLERMADLDLGSNLLNSVFPHVFLNMTRLRSLKLDHNDFYGTLSVNISRLRDLVDLDLSYNAFRGHIPSSLGRLFHLENLILGDNDFSGSISTYLQRNLALTHVDLSYNELTGTLPIFFNPILTYYDMSHNDFEGSIPPTLTDCRVLRYLAIQNNLITGKLPEELGNLGILYRISVDDNLMSGSLPSSLSNLKFLSTFKTHSNFFTGQLIHNLTCLKTLEEYDVGENYFMDTLPIALGNAIRLATLQADVGYLYGTIPPAIFQLKSLQICYLSRNYFTGELSSINLPPWNLPAITELKLDDNLLSGLLPDAFYNTTHLNLLNVSYNSLRGSLPPSLGYVHSLQTLSLSDNYFTGSIGNIFEDCTALQTLFLNDNIFQGSLSQMFDAGHLPNNLNLMDISGNQFSGTLPELFFDLPNISTFAAVRNCFTGSLPSNICRPKKTLITLALDGLHASSACNVVNNLGNSYSLASHLQGSVPTCLFEDMVALQTLHLAGNGIDGTWLSDIQFINPALQDLSLAHNNLRGNIPTCIQHRVWNNLDLSFNKLNGELDQMDIQAMPSNSSLYLQLNRLSGAVPSSVLNVGNISLVTGNIFNCPEGVDSLPQHDSDQISYVCASDGIEGPTYVWLAMTLSIISIVALLFYFRHEQLLGIFSKIMENCEHYWNAFYTTDDSIVHLKDFAKLAKSFRWLCLLLASILLIVFIPINGGFHVRYSTYKYVYGWVISGCYLSGEVPAMVGMVLYSSLLISMFSYFLVDLPINTKGMQRKFFIDKSDSKTSIYNTSTALEKSNAITTRSISGEEEEKKEVTWKDYAKWYAAMTLVIVFNCAVMLSINILFVDSITNSYSARVKQLIAIPMSLFKIIWKNVIMNTFEETLLVLRPKVTDVQERINLNKLLVTMFLWLALFNSIISPCISAAIASPECFKYLFVAPPSITTSFTVAECAGQKYIRVILGENYFICGYESSTTYSTTFVPPYSYSYQCSASLLSSFIPVFIFRFIFSGCIFPIVHIVFKVAQDFSYRKFGKQSRIFLFINDCLRTIFRPLAEEQELDYLKGSVITGGFNYFLFPNQNFSLLNFRKQVINFVTDLGILLTFGLIFPPLGVIAAISICVYSSFTQLILGRAIYLSRQNPALLPRIAELDRVANGAPRFFFEAIRSLSMLLVLFWSMFLLDILGDMWGLVRSSWILAVMGCLPTIIYLTNRVWKKKYLHARNEMEMKKAQEEHSKQDHESKDNGAIELPRTLLTEAVEIKDDDVQKVDVENPLHNSKKASYETKGRDVTEAEIYKKKSPWTLPHKKD